MARVASRDRGRRSSWRCRSWSCPSRSGVTGQRVLVVDDEPQFLRALQTNLRGAGYDVATADDGRRGAQRGGAPASGCRHPRPAPPGRPRHRRLPGAAHAGPTCRSSSSRPSARRREKIAALDAGADDYVTKPFAIGELLARLRAALRRAGPATEPVLEIGELSIDLEKRLGHACDGEPVHLTPHEFELLRVLAQNEGKLLTHKTILREVWGPAYQQESSYLHVFVSQLRRKLEPDPARPRYILTEPGAGYRLVNPADAPLGRPLERRREALARPQAGGSTFGAWRSLFRRTRRRAAATCGSVRSAHASTDQGPAHAASDTTGRRRGAAATGSPPLRLAWRVEELVTPKNRLDLAHTLRSLVREAECSVPSERVSPSTASPSEPRPRRCSQWPRDLRISRGLLQRAASFRRAFARRRLRPSLRSRAVDELPAYLDTALTALEPR